MSPAVEELVWTRAEVSLLLKVSLTTVKGLLASGALPHVKIGRRSFVRESDLRVYVESLKPAQTGGAA